jgi:signal transduction histidine kinase
MTRRLVIAMVILVAVTAIALAIPMAVVVSNDQRAAFVSELEVDTMATASLMGSQPNVDWQATADAEAARIEGRVIVVDADRNLVVDSSDSSLDRVFDRPEIDAALAGDLASDVRYSQTLASELRYVAAPIVQNYQVVGAVRLSLSESDVDQQIRTTQAWLAAFVVGVVIAAGLVAWLLAKSIAAPLTRLAVIAGNLPNDLDLRASETNGPREVRDVAASLNSTAAKLSGIIRRTERVAADASHHLRTPLTGLRLRLEAISDTATDDAVQREAELAMSEVDRLTRRIDQVLALARTDAGDSRLFFADLAVIARARAEAAEPIAEESGVAIDVESVGECTILAPAGVPARVVDELLGNALAYTRSRISVSVTRDRESVIMSVGDDGPGIADADRDRVFERFYRAEGARPGGSGLGLALVREAVEVLGGQAKAGVSRWGGAEISVQIPASPRVSERSEPPQSVP